MVAEGRGQAVSCSDPERACIYLSYLPVTGFPPTHRKDPDKNPSLLAGNTEASFIELRAVFAEQRTVPAFPGLSEPLSPPPL